MTRKIKTFGLAMIAVLAMSALVASAAQAQFTGNAAPTTFTGHSEMIIIVDNSSIECTEHEQGHIYETSVGSVFMYMYMSNCRAFGFASATVNMNGCGFIWYENGAMDISCPSGKAILITAGNCEVQVGAQSGLSKVKLTNHHPHIDALPEVSGITANKTKDGFLCPLSGIGHATSTYIHEEAVHLAPYSGGTTISID